MTKKCICFIPWTVKLVIKLKTSNSARLAGRKADSGQVKFEALEI